VTQKDARNTVSILEAMQLNMIANSLSSSLTTQLGLRNASQQTRVTYPAPYEKVRECGVSGNVSTLGEKSNIITYHVTNTFNDCTHIGDIVVNGTQKVDATFINNKLSAMLTDNDITVARGALAVGLTSEIQMYADRQFDVVEIILKESGELFQSDSALKAVFHDFNVTLDTTSNSIYLNGLFESDACGVAGYTIETTTPLVPNTDGSFASGELIINGVNYEYHDDYSVTATLGNGDVYVLPQGVSVFCELE